MVKVERSFPAPESLAVEALKENGSYSEKDVVERLRNDFHDKCYICEVKGLQDPEVEHLLPHKRGKYPERKFDWNNLFWCCGHCNRVKNKEKYDEGIIDCCNQEPEELLCCSFKDNDVQVYAKDPGNTKAVLTAELIYETFNLKNTGIRIAACDNRIHSLMESMDVLYHELDRYRRSPKSKLNIRRISALLRRDSAFAAFKRGYVRERLSEYPELKEFVAV